MKNIYKAGWGRVIQTTLFTAIMMISTSLFAGPDCHYAEVTDTKPSLEKIQYPVVKEDFGFSVESVSFSAVDSIVDVRIKVIEPEKVKEILTLSTHLVLIDEKTGQEFIVPTKAKIGSLRQSTRNPEKDRVYFFLFANKGRTLTAESKVTLRFGKHSIAGLSILE